MNSLAQVVAEVEAGGVSLQIQGDGVRIRYQKVEQRVLLTQELGLLRAHRSEVAEFLRVRAAIRGIRPNMKLVEWSPKESPVAIETWAVVVDVHLFIMSTLAQLRTALAHRKSWVGWTVSQLIDRLKQVGVTVQLDPRPMPLANPNEQQGD